jgi:hypothetical protein
MPLPIVPIVIAIAALAIVGKKKPKPSTNGGGGNGGGARQPKTVSVTIEELAALTEIPLFIGDTLRVSAPEAPPHAWTLYTEVTEGDPLIVVTESTEAGGGGPGSYGTKVFQIDAVQAQDPGSPHSVGVIRSDFLLCPPAQDPLPPCEPQAGIDIVITA